jgi:hypothetical protein
VKLKHSLAVVVSVPRNREGANNAKSPTTTSGAIGSYGTNPGMRNSTNNNNGNNSGGQQDEIQQFTLLVLHGSVPSHDSVVLCIPLMGLSTFTREWVALHSIHSHMLMPLAPYILSATPVVSAERLGYVDDFPFLRLISERVSTQRFCVSLVVSLFFFFLTMSFLSPTSSCVVCITITLFSA